jgi:flagellin
VTIDVTQGEAGVTYTTDSPGAGQIRITNGTTGVAQTLTVQPMVDNAVQALDFGVLGVKLTLAENAGAYIDGLTAAEIVTDLSAKTMVTTGLGAATFRVGAEVVDNVTVVFSDMRAAALGNGGPSDIADLVVENQSTSTVVKADALLSAVDTAIGQVSNFRARLGAAQNQMEAAVNSVGVSVENLVSSESRIRDADIAKVSSEMISRQIMQQAGVAVLAQANTAPQAVLALLQ